MEQAHDYTASSHTLHPMMGSEMIALRSMPHISCALFCPDAEDRCVMNFQKVIERLRRKRPRKMSRRQAYFRALMLEVKAGSRSTPQAPKEKIMARHVKLLTGFRRLTSGVGTRWPQTSRASTFAPSSRMCSAMWTRPTWSYRGLMPSVHRVNMIRLEYNDWAELFWTLANSCVLATQRGDFEAQVLRFSARRRRKCKTRSAKSFALQMWKRPKGKAQWLPSLCWNREAFRDAAVLISSEEGAQALFVLFASKTHQAAVFCFCEGSSLLNLP